VNIIMKYFDIKSRLRNITTWNWERARTWHV